jgi:hypothetical protein
VNDRTVPALLLAAALVFGVTVTACSDDGNGNETPHTTQSEDSPQQGPQSSNNPAGTEPVNGSTPPNG